MPVKIVSFDVDGTLVSPDFVNAVWLEGIPSAYAQEKGISFERAYEIVTSAYDEVGENRIEWYDLGYWLRRFRLKITKEELFSRYEEKIKIYDEVEDVLRALNPHYKLIICSNAAKDFIFFQIKPIIKYFSHIFSATSDFKQVKKSQEFYAKVCKMLGVEPAEVIHVGDHPVFDFANPREIGINAFLLRRGVEQGERENSEEGSSNCTDERRDRGGGGGERCVITDLREILNVLKEVENDRGI